MAPVYATGGGPLTKSATTASPIFPFKGYGYRAGNLFFTTNPGPTAPTTGPITHWKLNEGAGMTAADSSGGGVTATLAGPAWAAGHLGSGALDFDGIDDRLTTSGAPNVSNNFTLSFWADPHAAHQVDAEGTTGAAGTSGQKYAWWPSHQAGEAGAGVSVGTNGVSVYEHGSNYMPATLVHQATLSGWTHVAVVYENKRPKLYLNGALVRTGLASPRANVKVTPQDIGGNVYGYYDGLLDDVRLYDRALPAAEVAQVAGTQEVTSLVTGMSLGAQRADSPGWTGMKLTTAAQPVTVVSLGRYCAAGNSLSHELRLIRASDNTVVASAHGAMSGCTAGQFKYTPLTAPVTLAAGTDYLLVSYEVGSDNFHDWLGTVLTTTPAAAVRHGVNTTDGGQTWGPAGGAGNSYVPLDFQYQTGGTPAAPTAPYTPPHALSLNGSGAYVSVPYSSSLNITGPITIEAWVKRNPGAYQAIVERYGPNDGGYALRIEADRLCFYTLNNSQDFDRLVSNSVISTGVWHHVAAVFDGAEKQIFIDGLLDTSAASTFGPGPGAANLRIGVAGDADESFFSGLIDEVRVTAGVRYATSFTPPLIHGADGSDTRGLWNFEAQTAHDSSGKSNHGAFVGGAYCSSACPASEMASLNWITTQAADQPVKIDFDVYAHATPIATQYPTATFSSGLNQGVVTYNPRYFSNDFTTPLSAPNTITRYSTFWPFPYNHFAPLTVEFPRPVNNLRFGVAGINAFWSVHILDVDIYQNGTYKTTWSIGSLGWNVNMHVNIGQPANQFGINEVTKIVIRNIDDPYGIAFDDFTFNTPPLRVDITNPRIAGSLNGTTQKALTGGDIKLQAAPSFSGGSFSWTFTGPAVIVGGAANSASVTIRSTDIGNITAKVSYTQGGSVVTETVNINALLPSLGSYTAQQATDLLTTATSPGFPCNASVVGDVFWQLGCPPFAAGIEFTASAALQPGSYLTDPSQAGIKYVQAVSALRKRRFASGNVRCLTGRASEEHVDSGWRLDNDPATGDGDPYDSRAEALRRFSEGTTLTIATEDSPRDGWGRDTVDAAKNDDRFQMYVVYFVGHQRTPTFQRRLGSLSWSWKGDVVYDIEALTESTRSVPYRFIPPRQHDQPKSIARDPVVSTTIYQGLNSDIATFGQCPLGPPPVQNPIDGSRFYVNQHYWDFFNRAPDPPGSNFWTSNITKCAFDATCIANKRVDVARAFFYSQEFISQIPGLAESLRGTDSYNREFVRQCYYRYLCRTCDPEVCDSAGFNFWADKLNSQWPTMGNAAYDEMLRAFITSNEYRQRFGPL